MYGCMCVSYMCYHHHAVLGQVDVRLDAVGSCLDRPAEGAHRVLGVVGLVSPVGNGLWEAIVDVWLCPGPYGCVAVGAAVSVS